MNRTNPNPTNRPTSGANAPSESERAKKKVEADAENKKLSAIIPRQTPESPSGVSKISKRFEKISGFWSPRGKAKKSSHEPPSDAPTNWQEAHTPRNTAHRPTRSLRPDGGLTVLHRSEGTEPPSSHERDEPDSGQEYIFRNENAAQMRDPSETSELTNFAESLPDGKESSIARGVTTPASNTDLDVEIIEKELNALEQLLSNVDDAETQEASTPEEEVSNTAVRNERPDMHELVKSINRRENLLPRQLRERDKPTLPGMKSPVGPGYIVPVTPNKMATEVKRLIDNYSSLGGKGKPLRALNILICVAGDRTNMRDPIAYPETDQIASTLSNLPDRERAKYMFPLFEKLEGYLPTEIRGKIRNSIAELWSCTQVSYNTESAEFHLRAIKRILQEKVIELGS